MSDYRDPQYRDPNLPGYRDPEVVRSSDQWWSATTWGWIAGIAVVALVLVFAFGGNERTATDTTNPPATTGQRTLPAPPARGPPAEAPSMNRPAPVEPAPGAR